jgi:hypothetical protein
MFTRNGEQTQRASESLRRKLYAQSQSGWNGKEIDMMTAQSANMLDSNMVHGRSQDSRMLILGRRTRNSAVSFRA